MHRPHLTGFAMPSLIRPVSRAGNRLGRLLSRQYRLWTAERRCLPDFIIIGTQKGGTTSLFHYLAQHPQLEASWRKEVHFFDGGLNPRRDNHARGERWYRANFPLAANMTADEQAFEASPLYLFHPLAPARMAALLPEVRLIALLRNPVERALSHYFHEVRKGREPLAVMEALQSEEARLAPVLETGDYKHTAFMHFSYKLRGHYAEQIRRYHQYFPRENLLVLSSEAFFSEPQATLARIFDFIGVDAANVPNLVARNVGSNRTLVAAPVYDYLQSYFQPLNQDLYELLGTDFGWE